MLEVDKDNQKPDFSLIDVSMNFEERFTILHEKEKKCKEEAEVHM